MQNSLIFNPNFKISIILKAEIVLVGDATLSVPCNTVQLSQTINAKHSDIKCLCILTAFL